MGAEGLPAAVQHPVPAPAARAGGAIVGGGPSGELIAQLHPAFDRALAVFIDHGEITGCGSPQVAGQNRGAARK
jgi:hypothetical protein